MAALDRTETPQAPVAHGDTVSGDSGKVPVHPGDSDPGLPGGSWSLPPGDGDGAQAGAGLPGRSVGRRVGVVALVTGVTLVALTGAVVVLMVLFTPEVAAAGGCGGG
jgi:hypothetical protein